VDYGAIDLHKKESQVRIVTERGEVMDRRIRTTRPHLTAMFDGRSRMRILIEASTESEWVACHLEGLGHEVVIADPNYAPMYGHRTRQVKTDRRDVAALAEACQRGIYRRAHRRSAGRRIVHEQLKVRQELVTARTRAISVMRSLTRGAGVRIRSGHAETFLARLAAIELPVPLSATLQPLCRVVDTINAELAQAEDQFARLVADDPVIRRLTTFPGIGPITASAYVAALDEIGRFGDAGHVTSYLGLVPREYSSGEQRRRGGIVRSAHPTVQALLVQAAWRVWRVSSPRTTGLRWWADAIARRRGKKIAVVALARRIARILFAMWRDEVVYQPHRTLPPRLRLAAASADHAPQVAV
jgi:transposase